MTLLDDLLAVCVVRKVADSEVKASKKSVRKQNSITDKYYMKIGASFSKNEKIYYESIDHDN